MDYSAFEGSTAGLLRPTIQGAKGFAPNSLPPDLDLGALADPLQRAALALGELKGIGVTLANPFNFITPFQRWEAVASSRIEGTVSSLSDLLLFEEGARNNVIAEDAQEVLNYVRALEYGLGARSELSLSLRLIRHLHSILMKGVGGGRGAHLEPGEFRRQQNWIGGRSIEQARFVPCPQTELASALDAFERYLNQEQPTLPALVDLALIHYQFETIHPFLDGNGRVGRLLIPLYLATRGGLDQPLLYLSPFLERHKDEYIDRLFAVSAKADWTGWVRFFLNGIEEQAKDTSQRIRRLYRLRAQYVTKMSKRRNSIHLIEAIDLAFERLYFNIPTASKALKVTYTGARNILRPLVEEGILEELNVRPRILYAREITDIFMSPSLPR